VQVASVVSGCKDWDGTMGCGERQNSPGSNQDLARERERVDLVARHNEDCNGRIRRECRKNLGYKNRQAVILNGTYNLTLVGPSLLKAEKVGENAH
jgi:hypothetical protein